eukprot:CAMPEP_0118671770 /NCGR_PEP_ID=MMETSP0785-20121206/22179_1 /TAXON_ID=91992 /ORGANISM="Bolidomonas pacifica, Strain CCMP 1866" /LENGTH=156 /DNA_ID=CAMNT_0006566677 /DNA_START=32 /DNA_END=499 /DNA_ORIENTATION=+
MNRDVTNKIHSEEEREMEEKLCECPKFLVSFSPKFFQPECIELMREAHKPAWEDVLETIEDIVDGEKEQGGIGMYLRQTARKLYLMLLETGMGGKGNWEKFAPIIDGIKYSEGTTLPEIIGEVKKEVALPRGENSEVSEAQRCFESHAATAVALGD